MSEALPPPSPDAGESDPTLAVSGLVIALAVVSVALRFYTRISTRTGLGFDDWLILIAVFAALTTAALLLWGNSVDPNGQSVADNTNPSYHYASEDVFYFKISFACSLLYFTIAGATKLGILLMYNRIFHVDRAFRWQLWCACIAVIVFWIGCTVATLASCIPLKWSWLNGLTDPRYCFNYDVFWMASGACEILLDAVILALPVRAVTQLQLSTQRKVTIVGIFLLGGFVIVTGLVRVVLGYKSGGRAPSSKTETWTAVHAGMAIVCANLPLFKPLISRLAGSTLVTKISSYVNPRRGSASDSGGLPFKEDFRPEAPSRKEQERRGRWMRCAEEPE